MKYATLLPSNKKIPINTIFCVGQNYAEHAKEMGGTVASTPVIFLKPSNAVIENGTPILLPKLSNNVHHEVELTVLVGKRGRNISKADAMAHVAGYGVGLDMTMRDVQLEAKKSGNPWSIAKGFFTSAPLSPFIEAANIPDPHQLNISLKVNGTERQRTNTSKMNFKVDDLIVFLSSVFSLEEGDIIYTGTPEGVAQVVAGDVLEAEILTVGTLTHTVV
ncbi:MAG: fumarylacetoacetate hydrolase family protein [Ignavibacteriales bacterium]|nr:fumarylacetoacetate hydrolase family protein [Ignavibacteriales bacterium]